jgi:CO/xanthine dehydrogenase FAD-binding subunit
MYQAHDQRVFMPQGIPDLFSIMRKRPDCMVWAGGTWIGTSDIARLDARSRDLISLQRIDELKRIFRTDRYLELGATVTLDRILRLSERFLPASLRQAILETVPAPARSLATLGGNLCIPTETLNLLPWAATMDVRLEVRRQGGVRFIPAARLYGAGGEPGLAIGEILTRIRIPTGRWNHQSYRRLGGKPGVSPPLLGFCGLADVVKGQIEDLRISYAFTNSQWYIFPSLDAEWVGKRLPASPKDIAVYGERIARELLPLAAGDQELLAWHLEAVLAWFFHELPWSRQ